MQHFSLWGSSPATDFAKCLRLDALRQPKRMRYIAGMANASPRERLLNLIATNSFRLGNFTLSSGLKSDYYIDCRTTTLHAEGAELTGQVFLELFREKKWLPQAIGGLTLGADPIVTAVAVISSQQKTPIHG